MTEDEKKKIERYFANTATPREAEWVLKWFDTSGGKQYLDRSLRSDVDDLFNVTHKNVIHKSGGYKYLQKQNKTQQKYRNYALLAAAAVFLVTILSAMFLMSHSVSSNESTFVEEVEFSTDEGEHRVLTLGDGSTIRLNENSSLSVEKSNSDDSRRVVLKGEAYFDIVHNKEKPFSVNAGEARVEVLGTSFIVKKHHDDNTTLVAVTEGVVSFGSLDSESSHSIQLERNMIGVYNSETSTIQSENADTRNYLSWFNGRLVFEGESFRTVLNQLGHIYNTEMVVTNEELYNINLTADISATSMEEVMETIGETLGLEYRRMQDTVTWKKD